MQILLGEKFISFNFKQTLKAKVIKWYKFKYDIKY